MNHESTSSKTSRWFDAGSVDSIPLMGARQMRTEHGVIAIVRTGSGAVHAIGDACPHRGGPLSQGMVFGEQIQCPMHGLVIDLLSGTAVAPDSGAVPVYPVRIDNDRILVDVAAASAAVACSGNCACAAA